jgi:hypothetical protein
MLATASAPDDGCAVVVLPLAIRLANSGTWASGSQSVKPSRQMYDSLSISPAAKRACTSATVSGPTCSWSTTMCQTPSSAPAGAPPS